MAKELVTRFCDLFSITDINWAREMSMAKKILVSFSLSDILYCLDYYKDRGFCLNSLSFFIYRNYKNVNDALREKKLEEIVLKKEDDSCERNRERIRNNNKTNSRKESYFDLFEES